MARPWKPLLEGEDAAPAWHAIEDIAAALESWPAELELSPTLASGAAGLTLFYTYLAAATDDERWADAASKYLDHMIDTVPQLSARPSLYSGFTGAAWTLEHLKGRLLEDDGKDQGHHEIDQVLLALLKRGTWPGDYDLINGLAGFGVYALEIYPRSTGRECLGLLLDQLERLADDRPDGLAWHTRPELLPDHQRRACPAGYYNLGLAHGVPAVAALLGALCAIDLDQGSARQLLEPAVAWLIAQQLGPDADSRFPHSVADGIAPGPSRLAWCDGDPGVAIALLLAARLAGNSDWESEAKRIALQAANRAEAESGIADAGLCHGSAGLGHLFNRCHHLTGEMPLQVAARFWYRRTLEMRRPGKGVAGYLAYSASPGDGPEWREARGFLEGAAGIGLALLAAVSPLEPAWDRVLMTSIRSEAGHGSGWMS